MQNGKFSAFAELFVRTLKKVDFLKQRKKFIHVKVINKSFELEIEKMFLSISFNICFGSSKELSQ